MMPGFGGDCDVEGSIEDPIEPWPDRAPSYRAPASTPRIGNISPAHDALGGTVVPLLHMSRHRAGRHAAIAAAALVRRRIARRDYRRYHEPGGIDGSLLGPPGRP